MHSENLLLRVVCATWGAGKRFAPTRLLSGQGTGQGLVVVSQTERDQLLSKYNRTSRKDEISTQGTENSPHDAALT